MPTARADSARVATIVRRAAVQCAAFGCGWILFWHGTALAQVKTASETMFRQLDKSGDGVLTMDEATVGTRSFLERIFKAAGQQPDGRVSREEFMAAHERLRDKASAGIAKSPSASSSSADPVRSDDDLPTAGLRYIDTNGDGAITRGEWTKFTQAFRTLDTEKDGSLNPSEFQAIGGAAAELLTPIIDANGDGDISRIEWTRLPQGFAYLDANRDNALDSAELKKAADTAAAAASGTASLSGAGGSSSGLAGNDSKPEAEPEPTIWRGEIDGRGAIELVVKGKFIVGRQLLGDGDSESLGAGFYTMTGDGKSGNLDAVYTTGTNAGQVCLGIYLLNGDNLLWCVNNRGWRPFLFTGVTGDWLMTLTRVKPGPELQWNPAMGQ